MAQLAWRLATGKINRTHMETSDKFWLHGSNTRFHGKIWSVKRHTISIRRLNDETLV
jgi:hypothetical protein